MELDVAPRPMWRQIELGLMSTSVGNGQMAFVRVGDFLDLKDYCDKQSYYDALGEGPYQITELGKWRCGRLTVHIRCKKGKKYPINSDMFCVVTDTEMSRELTYEEMVLYFENRLEFKKFKDDPSEIMRIISEFDVYLTYNTYLDKKTNTICSNLISEHMLQGMLRTRTFLARYVGVSTEVTPAILCS